MKKFLSIILIILVIFAGMYLAYNLKYKNVKHTTADENINTVSNENNNKDKENIKEEKENELNNEVAEKTEEIDEEKQTEEEKQEVEKVKTTQEKAIEAVKKEWWGDEDVIFSIDNNNTNLKSNQIMVRVTQDGTNLAWYIVNTETLEVEEY